MGASSNTSVSKPADPSDLTVFISAPISATRLINRKMELIQQRLDNNQNVEGEYLTYLLSNTQMSIKDVYSSVTELLLAGVDTVNVHLNTFAFKFGNEQDFPWGSIKKYSDSIRRCLFTEMTPFLFPHPRRPPIPSHGLCTCCPNILNARKYFSKKCPHWYQQIERLVQGR